MILPANELRLYTVKGFHKNVVKVKKLNENYLFLFRIPVLNVDEMLESLVRKKR